MPVFFLIFFCINILFEKKYISKFYFLDLKTMFAPCYNLKI